MQTTERIVPQAPPPSGELPLPVQVDPAAATPVYGTAEPASGLPAQIRRQAYSLPQHDPNHWLLLLLADRVESGGNLMREAASLGQQGLVLRHFGRQIRSYPGTTAAFGALALGGLILAALARKK
ncbi:MAG TPA: hypothetical protein VK066_16620 [Chloroflexota bacterium]|nr:hypothetical protein [Chloroflexota bacterium]